MQGSLSFIVQSSTALPDLPAQAVKVEGGTVTGTSPVQGSGGRLFNVNVNSAQGARNLAISTLAGVGLANGLSTMSSNTLRVTLVNPNPQVHSSSPVQILCIGSYLHQCQHTRSFQGLHNPAIVTQDESGTEALLLLAACAKYQRCSLYTYWCLTPFFS